MVKTPKPILYLSLLGLLPVLAGVLGSLEFLNVFEQINHKLYQFGLQFSALILSFLGGCHFAFEIILRSRINTKGLCLSMAPAIWAIISLNLPMSCFLLAIGFLLALERERFLARSCQLPPWWMRMRLQLTSLMVIALMLMGFNA